MSTRWQAEFKQSCLGSITPTLDPFMADTFLIADGNGATYAAMRLRRMDIATGQELANVLLRSFVRCLCFSPDGTHILTVTDNKIFVLDRQTLAIIDKCDKQVPKYSDYAAIDDKGNLILMNHMGKTIWLYDYLNKKLAQKKPSKHTGCRHIAKVNADNYLIFHSITGAVQRYTPATNQLTTVHSTLSFCEALMDDAGNIYLHNAKHHTDGELSALNEITTIKPDGQMHTQPIAHPFKQMLLSKDGHSLYLLGDSKLWRYCPNTHTQTAVATAPKHTSIITYFEQHDLLLTFAHGSDGKQLMGVQVAKQ